MGQNLQYSETLSISLRVRFLLHLPGSGSTGSKAPASGGNSACIVAPAICGSWQRSLQSAASQLWQFQVQTFSQGWRVIYCFGPVITAKLKSKYHVCNSRITKRHSKSMIFHWNSTDFTKGLQLVINQPQTKDSGY